MLVLIHFANRQNGDRPQLRFAIDDNVNHIGVPYNI